MTAQEVFSEITSKPKWYAGYISPQYATNIKRKFNKGTLSYQTMKKLFNHFGYDVLFIHWHKVDMIDITIPRVVTKMTESKNGLYFESKPIKCKHEYTMSADSFEAPYCKHCFKEF